MDALGLAILFLILALAVALLLARWPVAAPLGLYACLLPFDAVLDIGQAGSLHIHLTWAIAAAVAGILLVRGLLRRSFVRPPSAALWPSLIVFWGLMSALWAINTERAVFRVPVIALLLVLYLAAACVSVSEKELEQMGWLAMLGGCLAAAISLYQLFHGISYASSHPNLGMEYVHELSGRGTLVVGDRQTNPNDLAATLILPLSLALGFLSSARTWVRYFFIMGVCAVIAAAIYKTGSRGGLLGTAVVLLVFLWRSPVNRRLTMPVAAVGTILLVAPQIFFSRFSSALADRGSGRLDIWQVGLWAMGHYTFVGAGLDCFPDVYNRYAYAAAHFEGYNRASHNIYLGMTVELGVIGILLLLGTVTKHYLLTANDHRADPDESSRLRFTSYEATFGGLLMCGFFSDLFWEEYFWFALMLLVMGARARQLRQSNHLPASMPQHRSVVHPESESLGVNSSSYI